MQESDHYLYFSTHAATIKKAVTFEGTTLHAGQNVRMVLKPAPKGCGIVFRRVDLLNLENNGERDIPARAEFVSSGILSTNLRNAYGVSVATVEHLMFALSLMGISNIFIDLDGPEVPIADGSGSDFVALLKTAGRKDQKESRYFIRIIKPVYIVRGVHRLFFEPYDGFKLTCRIDFKDKAIGVQHLELDLGKEDMLTSLARARTFTVYEDIEKARAAGLIRGGSLASAVVIKGEEILNVGGFRYDDECVRHKMLDAIGDLALAGHPILGHYSATQGGHALNHALVHLLLQDRSAFEWVEGSALDVAQSDILQHPVREKKNVETRTQRLSSKVVV